MALNPDTLRAIIAAHEEAALRAATTAHLEAFSANGQTFQYASVKELAEALKGFQELLDLAARRRKPYRAVPVVLTRRHR